MPSFHYRRDRARLYASAMWYDLLDSAPELIGRVRSFAELHDHLDANMLGYAAGQVLGELEEDPGVDLDHPPEGSPDDEHVVNAGTADLFNEASDLVDRWLRATVRRNPIRRGRLVDPRGMTPRRAETDPVEDLLAWLIWRDSASTYEERGRGEEPTEAEIREDVLRALEEMS